MFDLNTFLILFVCTTFMIFGLFFSKDHYSISIYLNAGRSIKSGSLTASIVASCFGVWILIGPSEAATWGGMGAVIGYALGQSCPYLAMSILGKKLRGLMPKGNSLTQFIFARYGANMLNLVLFLTLFYLFIYLCAEVTAIAQIVNLITGISLWKTSLLILITTLIYTLKGGLRISIITDKLQFIIIIIILFFIFYYIFFSGNISLSLDLINEKASSLISPKYFYGYTAGLTFFIAVFATNLFDQGVWQRVFAAKSNEDLDTSFKNSFYIVLPVIFILGVCGIIGVSLDQAKNPSTIIFSLLASHGGFLISSVLLILALTLVISSMDTLINAISSLIVIESKKFIKLSSVISYVNLSRIVLVLLSILIFYVASKGLSVLYMFLLADLLCCAAVIPVFYGMFKKDIDGTKTVVSTVVGLIGGLLFFPNISFEKSILVGFWFNIDLFPTWVSTVLLFWSFVIATILPFISILLLRNKNIKYNFNKIKQVILEIK
jgi:Na+/proline symporter